MRILALFLLLGINVTFGGFDRTDVGARAQALGNAYVGLADDVWSIFHNAAGLSMLTLWEAGFFYSPQPFGLSELSTGAAALAFPTGFGSLGAGVRSYGFNLYREFSGTLSFARSLSGVHAGISVTYHSVRIERYGSSATIGVDAGILVQLLRDIRLGIAIQNINSPTIGRSNEKLPQTFSTGIAYTPFRSLYIVADVAKETAFDISSRFGFEYWIIDALALRGGVSDQPSKVCAGTGIRFSIFQFDYSFSTHQELGWTHQFSLTVRRGDL